MSWLARALLGLTLAAGASGAALACAPINPCVAPPAAYGGPAGYYSAYGADQSYEAYRRGEAYVAAQRYAETYAALAYGAPHPSVGYGPPTAVFGPELYAAPPALAHGYPGYGYAGPCCVPCGNTCGGVEGLVLPSSFFGDAGGVGPIPEGGYGGGGGGFVIVGGGAGAGASAFASASASASASIVVRGGYGGHGGKGGHGGGYRGGHHGKGGGHGGKGH